jgi:Suppressor of fused protein (SUFU)
VPENPALHLAEIEAHVQRYLGPVESVFHEIASDLIHLDVLFIPPGPNRDYQTLVTSGASDLVMRVPQGMERHNRAEVLISLPAGWPLDQQSLKNEDFYWPIRLLKYVGRFPHEYNTWMGWGHTIANGDRGERIANTNFTGVMLSAPYWLGPEFFRLETSTADTICFYSLVPLYQEEIDLKLRMGAKALEELFDRFSIGQVVDIARANVAKKPGWFRGLFGSR